MRQLYIVLIVLMNLYPGIVKPGTQARVSFQQLGGMGVIDWPVTGEHIQGVVVIRGSTPVDGLRYYEVDYSLTSDPNQAWVLIQDGASPIQSGILAIWDTTTIPDGEYNLRLLVNQTNGNQSVTNMYNLLVNNTVTPEPTMPAATAWYQNLAEKSPPPTQSQSLLQETPAVYLSASPTPLADNPAMISSSKAFKALGGGAVFTIAIFLFAGGFFGVRWLLDRRK